jgi:hypothetical protein
MLLVVFSGWSLLGLFVVVAAAGVVREGTDSGGEVVIFFGLGLLVRVRAVRQAAVRLFGSEWLCFESFLVEKLTFQLFDLLLTISQQFLFFLHHLLLLPDQLLLLLYCHQVFAVYLLLGQQRFTRILPLLFQLNQLLLQLLEPSLGLGELLGFVLD